MENKYIDKLTQNEKEMIIKLAFGQDIENCMQVNEDDSNRYEVNYKFSDLPEFDGINIANIQFTDYQAYVGVMVRVADERSNTAQILCSRLLTAVYRDYMQRKFGNEYTVDCNNYTAQKKHNRAEIENTISKIRKNKKMIESLKNENIKLNRYLDKLKENSQEEEMENF